VLGGLLGDVWVRAPFLCAAALNALNLALAFAVLPESRAGDATARFSFADLDPFRPLGWAFRRASLVPLLAFFVVLNFVGTVYGTVWALFGQDTFAWSSSMVGLSLGAFGVCHAGAQAFLTGPAVARLGERNALVAGLAFELGALAVLAFATEGWVVFALAPLFALGGIGMPALQSITTEQVGSDDQGRLQGVLASLVSLAAVFGPLFFGFVYTALKPAWPGAVWLVGGSLYVLAVPLVLRVRRR
jgi:DHA1 family tetracycline resistance protein-like MFS transporter